jgi:uncharacterized protein
MWKIVRAIAVGQTCGDGATPAWIPGGDAGRTGDAGSIRSAPAMTMACAFRPVAFRASSLLQGAHAQTIAGRLLRRSKPEGLRRVRIDTPDGDFLDLDFASNTLPGRPVVLLLHGLEGSARRGYALNVYSALAAYGIGAVGLNFRSCSGEPNRLARSYHSGDTGDLRHVLEVLPSLLPGSPIAAIGFSLGGNVLIKYMGEEGDAAASRLSAAVAVSVPYDLGECERALDSTVMGRFYVRIFLRTLVAKAEAKKQRLPANVSIERIRQAKSFRDFDDAATAPLHGFDDAADYYARASSAPFVARVRVPSLLIQAEDDPFLPSSAIPRAAIASNPCLQPLVTPKGGHVGFIAGSPIAPRFWVEQEAARYLAQRLAGAAAS